LTVHPTALPDKLESLARAGAEFAVIDTPPAADIMAREAGRAADFLLIPCRPRVFDLDAVKDYGRACPRERKARLRCVHGRAATGRRALRRGAHAC
jgi:cellulose biosynthesis protein BcsQ